MAEESKLAEKYEDATKFSEEDMGKIKSFQEKYLDIQRTVYKRSYRRAVSRSYITNGSR